MNIESNNCIDLDNNFFHLNNNDNGFNNIVEPSIPSFLFLSDNENKYFEKIDNKLSNNNNNNIKNKFLSLENIDIINTQLINNIYNLTKKQIKKQDIITIKSIMESIYEQYYSHLHDDIEKEINKLNNKTLVIISNRVLSNLNMTQKYMDDISQKKHINILPEYVSNSGKNIINTQKRMFDLYHIHN